MRVSVMQLSYLLAVLWWLPSLLSITLADDLNRRDIDLNATTLSKDAGPAVPEIITSASDPNRQQHYDQIRTGILDAWNLATVAYLTFQGPCDDVFLRYFDEGDADFVRRVFAAIAGIDPEVESNIENARQIALTSRDLSKYTQASIAVGDHPSLDEAEKQCSKQHDYLYSAYTVQFGELEDRALISICNDGLKFPGLKQIIDAALPLSQGGPGCAGLGTHDNGLMTSLGGQLLHEFVHWRYLLQDIPNFNELIGKKEEADNNENIIVDYQRDESDMNGPIDPVDGYGPQHAKQLAEAGEYLAINNADNYRWYAQSKYWQWKCNRNFEESNDNEADGDVLRTNAVDAG